LHPGKIALRSALCEIDRAGYQFPVLKDKQAAAQNQRRFGRIWPQADIPSRIHAELKECLGTHPLGMVRRPA
jgi:hypothetical protein